MSWNYADLSHFAKINGGPENAVRSIYLSGFNSGVVSMKPVIVAVGAISFGVGILGVYLYQNWQNRKNQETDDNRIESERELISGIEEFDNQIFYQNVNEQGSDTKSDDIQFDLSEEDSSKNKE